MADVESAWEPVPDGDEAIGWLKDLDPGHGHSGYEPPRRPDAAWILHSMYVWKEGLVTTTHDDVHRTFRAAGLASGPEPAGDGDLGDLMEGAVVTGTRIGRGGHPGPGWRRLRWALPGSRCLRQAHPTGSWPAAIEPPAEGCLDREGWRRLTALLVEHDPDGEDRRCLAYYCSFVTGDWDTETILAGRLGDAADLYDHPAMSSCPSNLWARDRSWAVYCDWDLWGTKVAGPSSLIEAILADPELEALRLPWTS
jgi:hypothetical protein